MRDAREARIPGRVLAALALVAWAAWAFAVDVPYMTGRIVDNAEILSPAARGDIE